MVFRKTTRVSDRVTASRVRDKVRPDEFVASTHKDPDGSTVARVQKLGSGGKPARPAGKIIVDPQGRTIVRKGK